MKKLISFRLDSEVLALIEILSKEYEIPKVKVVENAIKQYAKIKSFHKKDLIKFIGKVEFDS